MLKKTTFSILFLWSIMAISQNKLQEQFPIFSTCQDKQSKVLETCFYNEVQTFVYNNFEVPENFKNSKTIIIVLFEVNEKGEFKVQYIDAIDETLKLECIRVFSKLPKIKPATINGNDTFSKYTIRIEIPLQNPVDTIVSKEVQIQPIESTTKFDANKELKELDSIKYQKFQNPQFKSNLNIPLSHSFYSQFDAAINQVGANNHTVSKPLTYSEVSKYYNLEEINSKLMKNKNSLWGKKLWNENAIQIQSKEYWFTINPIFDLQFGKSDPSKTNYTYINTRGLQVRGGIGKQINFTTSIFESQGRFADYFNRYAESIAPSGGNPAIIPGIGIAKEFNSDAYDFPLAEANLTFTPNSYFNFQAGYGRNFLGDGYRSLLLSDGASPYPYFKINTTFWKIKYTNTYMWLKDVRDAVTVDQTYATKYVANHYLSWNVSNKINIGFFESVVWSNQNNRGFDMSFVNPIIFYRTVEFSSSSKSGNALLGITAKYKWNNQINFYSQFLIDEFSLSDMKSGKNSWKNKFGYQLGVKYYNAFNIKNLLVQAEYNQVRPYVYSHSDVLTNYGHNNQSLGHQWGGNFKELIAIARYHNGRYFADAKLTIGKRGLDFSNTGNNSNYGSNIFRSYNENRFSDTGVVVGQGNKTNVFIADLQAGYLINPVSNLKVFGSMIYRNFNPATDTSINFKENTTWFSFGVRCDIFNWYFDY